MSIVQNQRRILGQFIARLRPHWRRDPALPERIEKLLSRDRRLGSRDRRLYRELLYTGIRHLPWIDPLVGRAPDLAVQVIALLAAETPATHAFRAAAGFGPGAAPATVAGKAAAVSAVTGDTPKECLLPAWFERECPEAFVPPNYDAINTRAPLWLRLQTDDAGAVFAEFSARGWTWRAGERLPGAIELPGDADVTGTDAYRRGWIEIQDIGSQLVIEAIGVKPGERWLDACAGAGGKSLQLAGLLGPGGHVDACDVRKDALAELGRRAARAGLTDRISRPAGPKAAYDGVLVDAPCSGSGTWRRSPHLKWVTTPVRVQAFSRRQRALLAHYSAHVRPGGRLVYATCSLCQSENERVVAAFLSDFPSFAPAPFTRPRGGEPREAGLVLWPATHDGDGYFVASLKKSGIHRGGAECAEEEFQSSV